VPTIAKLEIVPLIYRLPKGRAYGMARGLTAIRQASLVKLTTDDGVEASERLGGHLPSLRPILNSLSPILLAARCTGSSMLQVRSCPRTIISAFRIR
jgi:hypothetical protein